MHPRSILAIARKDMLDILLNKATLTLLLTPIFLALVFVAIQLLLSGHTTNILLYNPGRSHVEQIIQSAFSDAKITEANSPNDVTAAFGPNGSQKNASYALGLVVPADFDSSLQAGGHPQLQLYIDGSQISNQQSALLQSAFINYARNVANPQPPATITLATVNPPQPNSGLQDLTQIYGAAVLLASFMIGTSLVPGMIAEEKEKKTLRMLMVTPASFADVVAGKLLVGLAYQIVLTLVVLTVKNSFTGQVPLVLLFVLLGSCFSVTLGLLAGSIFQTTSAAGAFSGIISFIYILPIFFVGSFGQVFNNSPFTAIIKLLPTYYIADGTANALSGNAQFSGTLLDVGVVLACIVLLFLISVTLLRRQAAVIATI